MQSSTLTHQMKASLWHSIFVIIFGLSTLLADAINYLRHARVTDHLKALITVLCYSFTTGAIDI